MQAWYIAAGRFETLAELPLTLPDTGMVWVACTRDALPGLLPTLQDRLTQWAGAPLLDLHVSDLLNEQLPSHFDSTLAYDLMVLQRPSSDGVALQIDTHAIGFAVYARLLLSVHPAACPVLVHFGERLSQWGGNGHPASGNRLPASPDELMLRMANQVVDGYLNLRRHLTRQHAALQEALIDTRRPFEDWSRLLTARDTLLRLEDLCEDQQSAVQEWLDALAEWPQGEGPPEQEALRVRGRDLLEHIARVLSHVRRLASSTESAVQMHYAALSHRTNNIMRVLTALTAVFLPLNLITGIFGMNFDALPLIHNALGVWIALGLMTFVGLGLFWWFRLKRYLGSRP